MPGRHFGHVNKEKEGGGSGPVHGKSSTAQKAGNEISWQSSGTKTEKGGK